MLHTDACICVCAGAGNLVPMEIALKVASKIAAGERFAVYIVIPMWPEGVPTSGPIQEILFWQRQTMQAMYEVIAAAIRAAGMEGAAHPRDYLNFYCLGKREAAAAAAAGSPEAGGDLRLLRGVGARGREREGERWRVMR